MLDLFEGIMVQILKTVGQHWQEWNGKYKFTSDELCPNADDGGDCGVPRCTEVVEGWTPLCGLMELEVP